MQTSIPPTLRLSTAELPRRERPDWLREVIGREYVRVGITPPRHGDLFNEMTIHSWRHVRLSIIRSSGITIERLSGEPYRLDQDAYFVVVPLYGQYVLEQRGRTVVPQPGDLTLYDATSPHRIHCPDAFGKLILAVPRKELQARLAGIQHCTALRIRGDVGIGNIASGFIRSLAGQASRLSPEEILSLSTQLLDLLTMALASVHPARFSLSRSRLTSLGLVKEFVERYLAEPDLNTAMVAEGVGFSPRYINDLFKEEETSLMRHVWRRRLEKCRDDLLDPAKACLSLTDLAYRWGFQDMSHFSRAFKQAYDCPPREYRQRAAVAPPVQI